MNEQAPVSPTPPAPAPAGQHSNNTVMAVLAYLGILIIIPFLTDAKNDPFVKFHLKQGLALIVLEIISWLVGGMLGYVVSYILQICIIVLAIIGILNVLSKKQSPLPVIGKFGERFSI